MACSFANLENACGCLIGYQLPLKTADNADIDAYPVTVLNVNSEELGEAANPSAYVALWNSDTDNQAKGVLSVGTGSFCFVLSRISGVTPPSKVLGVAGEVEGLTFSYGYTDLDTTGETPTEQAYIDATPVSATSDPISTGDDVQVDDFGNATDAVCFMKIASTEAAFTKWSEVGNALQQDQPIDAAYGTGTAVWFKSVDGADTYYFTRAQTSFAGAIIFSR